MNQTYKATYSQYVLPQFLPIWGDLEGYCSKEREEDKDLTLDDIRDYLIGEGYDIIISYDGNDSVTLVKSLNVISAPSETHVDHNGIKKTGKNSLIRIGLTLQVPLKNN